MARKGKNMYILAYEMKYTGEKIEEPILEVVPFHKKYARQYMKLYNVCFHKMREEFVVEPFDYYRHENQLDVRMDKIYLYLVRGRIVGSFVLDGNEIDDVIVHPRYQGNGYGRKLVLTAVSMQQKRGVRSIILHAAAWNEGAIRLYEKCGFEKTLAIRVKHNA